MDLYRKKNKVSNLVAQRLREKYQEAENNPPRRYKKAQIRNETFDASSRDNIQNQPREREDISGNENNPRNNRYVIQIGRSREPQNPETEEGYIHPNKSAILNRAGRGGNYPYQEEDNYKSIPNIKLTKRPLNSANNSQFNTITDISRKMPNESYDFTNQQKKIPKGRVPKKYNNRYNDTRDDEYNDYRQNYIGIESSQNEFEISSINEDDRIPIKNARSPEPKLPPRIAKILEDRYKKDEGKTRYPNRRNMQGLRIKKQRIIGYNENADDEIDELIFIIEDLQNNVDEQKNLIRYLKIDNIKKDKEIDTLNNELDNMQKDRTRKRNG